MTDLLPIIAACIACFAAGGFAINWLKSRKTSTRTEGIRLALFAYKEALKLPSAADAIALAQEQAQGEAAAAAQFVALVAKSANVAPTV